MSLDSNGLTKKFKRKVESNLFQAIFWYNFVNTRGNLWKAIYGKQLIAPCILGFSHRVKCILTEID